MKIKFRPDITEYILNTYFSSHLEKTSKALFNAYEIDGKIYSARYLNTDPTNPIDSYGAYQYQIFGIGENEIKDISEKFNVVFGDNIAVCKCGEHRHFSARYENTNLKLNCNSCGNEFSTYS